MPSSYRFFSPATSAPPVAPSGPFDTREKRACAVSLTQSAPNTVTPNAAMDQEWRQESGWAYCGILVGAAVIPPVIPPVVEVAVGVIAFPTIDRRIFARWEREVREFWIEYFQEILELTEAQARLRTTDIMKAAETVHPKKPTKVFWQKYFAQVREMENMAYAIELDDEEIMILL